MNDSSSKTTNEPEGFFRRMVGRCRVRRLVILLFWCVTLLALFFAEENWRGRRVWEKARGELLARGDKVDYKDFIPPPVPDNQNFAATPLVQSWFPKGRHSAFGSNYFNVAVTIHAPMEHGRRQFVDLAAWKTGFAKIDSSEKWNRAQRFGSDAVDREAGIKAAPILMTHLKGFDSERAELLAASARPYSRYPLNYNLENPWGILLPHLPEIGTAVGLLQLRACAELAGQQSDAALEELNLGFYIADSVKEEPFLVSHLVRVKCIQMLIQPIWEGLAEHRWSDAQIEKLQARLDRLDLLNDMKRPLAAERAGGILTADLFYRRKYRPSTLSGDAERLNLADMLASAIPHGWYHLEQAEYCRLYDAQLEGTVDFNARRIFPKRVEASGKMIERELAGSAGSNRRASAILHHRLTAALLLPALGGVSRKAAAAQTAVDQAALACALERHRLARGQFPEKLDELVPAFIARLPRDLVGGEFYKYRRASQDHFILYSVGWNEVDDGGSPGKTLFDEKAGDWVWENPGKP